MAEKRAFCQQELNMIFTSMNTAIGRQSMSIPHFRPDISHIRFKLAVYPIDSSYTLFEIPQSIATVSSRAPPPGPPGAPWAKAVTSAWSAS